MLINSASAVIYDVGVYGVRSLNELGNSDFKIEMDDIKSTYSDFQQESQLTEYFLRDYGDTNKLDLNEAVSWLVDNNIIQRDQTLTVTKSDSAFPRVSLTKYDVLDYLPAFVHRSDFIMYLYKAVFGPIKSRAVGIETPNFRVYDNKQMLLSDMLKMFEESGERYSPQGDEYTTIFGDTNIFIADNDIHDNNATGGDAESVYGDAQGGDASNNEINIESDYKRIEYNPKADMFLYYSGDVVELYLQAALSKGILSTSDSLITDTYLEDYKKFSELNKTGSTDNSGMRQYMSWSSDNIAYVPNISMNSAQRLKVTYLGNDQESLGVNHTISSNETSLIINRVNFMNSDTGYFKNEKLTRMDVYNLIYDFIYASEKKLSELETDLVNYKYGMELDGIASSEDVSVIKYLIAKGILNYDSVYDLQGLYSPITWEDAIQILYRVANENARLDFSSIQLTDSETQWKAKGYAPQTMQFTESQGNVKVEVTDSGEDEPDGSFDFDQGEPFAAVVQTGQSDGSKIFDVVLNGQEAKVVASGENLNTLKLNSQFGLDVSYAYLDKDGILSSLKESISTKNDTSISALLNNIFIIMYGKNSPKLDGEIQELLKTYQDGGSGFLNRWKSNLDEFSNMKMITKATVDANGKKGPGNVTWYAALASGAKGIESYMTSVGRNPASQSDVAQTLCEQLDTIELTTTNSDTSTTTYIVRYTRSDESRARNYTKGGALGGKVEQVITPAEGKDSVEESESDLLAKASQQLSSTLTESKTDTGIKIQTSNESKMAFVSWNDIQSYNDKVGEDKAVPITRVSDLVLYNRETDTYAYFSTNQSKPIALVGTAVVTGDPSLGVAFKSGSGEGSEYYYLFDAIKLLMSAKDETTCIGGVRSVNSNTTSIQDASTKLPLMTTSGESIMSSLYSMKACISLDSTTDANTFGDNYYFKNAQVVHNTRWGQFLSLSSSNRVMNILYSPITYTSDGKTIEAYKVVKFKPSTNKDLTGGQISTTSTLQDVLDMPGKAPTTDAGKKAWSSNKSLANAYANWLYGTSGQTYIDTGYLEAVPYVYVLSENSSVELPASVLQPLTTEQSKVLKIVNCKQMNGAVVSATKALGSIKSKEEFNKEVLDGKYKATYYLANDLQVIIADGRLYANHLFFDNLKITTNGDGDWTFSTKDNLSSISLFSTGSIFRSSYPENDTLSTGDKTPEIIVTGTSSSGTITCQVGPFSGMPVNIGGSLYMLPSNLKDSYKDLTVSEIKSKDLLSLAYSEMFSGYGNTIKNLGVTKEPIQLGKNLKYAYVAAGTQLVYYENGVKSDKTTSIPTMSQDGVSTYDVRIQDAEKLLSSSSNPSPWVVQAYLTISFPAGMYTIRNNRLIKGQTTLSDVVSPSLYKNLNDYIIDGMINESNGAIPLEDVPAGAMITIGSNSYTPTVIDGKRVYVGYSVISEAAVGGYVPTMTDATKSFMPQMVRAGNQYLNVTHFFNKVTMLDDISKYKESLDSVVDSTLSSSSSTLYGVLSSGESWILHEPTNVTASGALHYVPLEIHISKGLLAYKTSSDTEEPAKYKLCSTIDDSITGVVDMGALSKLPFWNDSVLKAQLQDITIDLMSAGFIRYAGAAYLADLYRQNFQKAFEGDLLTLLRLIVFWVLCWLFLSAWLCYVIQKSGLMTFVEAIRYPTSNKSSKGIDVIKWFSLGTINADIQMTFGRLLLYEAVIAVLLMIVWKIKL